MTAMTVSDLSVVEGERMTQPLKDNGWQRSDPKQTCSEGFLIKRRVFPSIRWVLLFFPKTLEIEHVYSISISRFPASSCFCVPETLNCAFLLGKCSNYISLKPLSRRERGLSQATCAMDKLGQMDFTSPVSGISQTQKYHFNVNAERN